MKFRILIAAVSVTCLGSSVQGAVLAQYTFGTTGNTTFSPASTDPLLSALNVTGHPSLNNFLVNEGLAYASAPVLQVNPSNNATGAASAVSNNSYFSFTVSPDSAGVSFSLTDLTFDAARGGSGTPRGWVVRSSVDGFASNLGQSTLGTARPDFSNYQVSLADSSFQNLTGPVEFRVYSYSPSPSGNSVEYDNIILNGTAIPEPSGLLLAITGTGLLALRRRRA